MTDCCDAMNDLERQLLEVLADVQALRQANDSWQSFFNRQTAGSLYVLLPPRKLTWQWKSPFLIGDTSSNSLFSIVMSDFRWNMVDCGNLTSCWSFIPDIYEVLYIAGDTGVFSIASRNCAIYLHPGVFPC